MAGWALLLTRFITLVVPFLHSHFWGVWGILFYALVLGAGGEVERRIRWFSRKEYMET